MADAYVTALRLLKLGFSVIPSGGGEKRKAPLVNWRDYQTTAPDESQLKINKLRVKDVIEGK